MSDETKKILDKLRSDDYYEKEYQKSVYYERDLKELEDYITNLQDERERLINAWETAVDDFEKEYAKNERAKEVYIKELIEAHNRSEDMPLVAVEMYNILQGNKK